MKTKPSLAKIVLCAALLPVLGVLPTRTRAASDVKKVDAELQKILPIIRAKKADFQRDQDLRLISRALARTGNLSAALQAARTITPEDWQPGAPDEVWRITARRLAWQKSIAAATRCANRINSKYSRTDALLAIERAQVRAGNTSAAKRLLSEVEPIIRNSHTPHAIAYVAWQFARVGENQKARGLFQLAKTTTGPELARRRKKAMD